MPNFSNKSIKRLETCHIDLQKICYEVIKEFDFSVLCGYRGEEEQNAAYEAGNSKVKFPNSKHNKIPSLAIDISPWPIDWNDIERFADLSRRIKSAANFLRNEKIIANDIIWGGDWTTLKDYPHFEIKKSYSPAIL